MDTSGIRSIPQKITALKSLKELMILIGSSISSVSLQVKTYIINYINYFKRIINKIIFLFFFSI